MKINEFNCLMESKDNELALEIITKSRPIIRINNIQNNQWYRKPEGSRKGPWYEANYDIFDDEMWSLKRCCLYFVKDEKEELKYIGISRNGLKQRWRLSPAFDLNKNQLQEKKLFHSQCWPPICDEKKRGGNLNYTISVIHDSELFMVLEESYHQLSGLASLKNYPEIVIEAMEKWFILNFNDSLWNKRK